jgi:hypothetical protein
MHALHADSGQLDEIRFFTAKPLFFKTLKEWVGGRVLFECGSGSGHTTRELQERGFTAVPVDIAAREGQCRDTLIVDACQLKFAKSVWPLVCRPDHSGWAEHLFTRAYAQDAHAIYVGLKENVARDLHFPHKVVAVKRGVGVENEMMILTAKA